MPLDSARAEVEKLFDDWYPYLVRYGRRLCAEQTVVEDCIQQTMLLLFRKLLSGSKVPNPKAWVLLVLKREILRHLRRERNHVVLEDHPYPVSELDEYQGLPVSLDQVDSFLSLLSPREAEVLLLRMNGLKYREIAATLKIGGNSVNRLLSRAITKIRAWRGMQELAPETRARQQVKE